MLTKRLCCICRHWFVPNRRVGRRQRACSATACQIARRAATQASWRDRFRCELRDHREHGIEAQFFKNEEFLLGRGFDPRLDPTRTPREMAIARAGQERIAIEAYKPATR